MFMEFVEDQVFLFIALGVIILMLIYSYVGDKLAGFQTVSAEEAVKVFNRDAWVLDVRSEGEYKTGYIGEAENIASTDIAKKMESILKHKDEEVLVYCQSGGRSAMVAGKLVKQGFTKVHNLRGGVMSWKLAGYPLNMPQSKKQKKKAQKGAA